MATTEMPCANFTECCRQCNDVIVEFGTHDLIITACIAFVGGVISVLLVILAIKLKREKKLCFQEPVEPFRGKWEGASQKATIQVLKKHTLEKSLSSHKDKSLESSVEANVVANDDVNNSVESDEKLLTVKVIDENNEKQVLNDINVADVKEDKTRETNSSTHQLEQSSKESILSDKELQQDALLKLNANDTSKTEANASLDNSGTQDDHVDIVAAEQSGDAPANIETTDDETKNKTIQETNIESLLESDADKTDKPEQSSANKAETGELECGLEDKTVQMKDDSQHKSHVIVRDSSGAELFERGRDSTAFDPDELILQNDNFRMSQVSFN